MSLWLQHLLVLLLVAACVFFVARQGFRTLTFRKGKLGACCAKGCPTDPAKPGPDQRVHFLPVELLRSSPKKR